MDGPFLFDRLSRKADRQSTSSIDTVAPSEGRNRVDSRVSDDCAESRCDQATLFPEGLADWFDESNPVQVIDILAEEFDLAALGIDGVAPEVIGRPSYHPSVLLKPYLYGYLNRVQSSRRLDREAERNVEVMWLMGRFVPDHKTIADTPQGLWRCHSQGVCSVHHSLPALGRRDCQGRIVPSGGLATQAAIKASSLSQARLGHCGSQTGPSRTIWNLRC